MIWDWWMWGLVGTAALAALYATGKALIDAYFRAKAEYVETITRKLEGDQNAK
jgi:hypothetical protein